ncbi:hypothetical protein VNO78_31312 [Psophocarpus tetragonolobus]|uniref:Exocyst subunit Exo70 family protein n=1 Tax=Psophocarpus tetragonolobus TaxID=3891 RepID=A0AAN9RZ23_PSOTE
MAYLEVHTTAASSAFPRDLYEEVKGSSLHPNLASLSWKERRVYPKFVSAAKWLSVCPFLNPNLSCLGFEKQQDADPQQNSDCKAIGECPNSAFLALLATSVYSFFFDKEVKGKPDSYSLVSSAAFAVMSSGLSTITHIGFEVDLLYFFCQVLIIQLMKIKLWLFIVGGTFTYSLVILRSKFNPQPGSGFLELQDQNYTLINVEPLENVVTEIVWFSRGSNPSATVKAKFVGCIEALKKENESVINAISRNINVYVKANVLDEDQISVPKLQRDDNLLMDVLPEEIVKDLHQSIKQMVLEGFKKECLDLYTNCRREFLKETLSIFGLQFQELNKEDIDNLEKIESFIKRLTVALRLLFPNERKLCDRMFRGSISSREFAFMEVCTELASSLLSTAKAVVSWSNFLPETLGELMQEFEPGLLNEHHMQLKMNVTFLISKRLYIFKKGYASLATDGWLHPITYDVINYVINYVSSISRSLPVYVIRMIELLESNLEAKSKELEAEMHGLGYVFIMNNRWFINQEAKLHGLGPILGYDWLKYNTEKFQQNLELYHRSSWNKILEFLKLDINESEPIVAELMKDRLFWFYEHFDETCNVQSDWSAFDEPSRKFIIKSIEDILLPAYGNFVGRFQKLLVSTLMNTLGMEYLKFKIDSTICFQLKCTQRSKSGIITRRLRLVNKSF